MCACVCVGLFHEVAVREERFAARVLSAQPPVTLLTQSTSGWDEVQRVVVSNLSLLLACTSTAGDISALWCVTELLMLYEDVSVCVCACLPLLVTSVMTHAARGEGSGRGTYGKLRDLLTRRLSDNLDRELMVMELLPSVTCDFEFDWAELTFTDIKLAMGREPGLGNEMLVLATEEGFKVREAIVDLLIDQLRSPAPAAGSLAPVLLGLSDKSMERVPDEISTPVNCLEALLISVETLCDGFIEGEGAELLTEAGSSFVAKALEGLYHACHNQYTSQSVWVKLHRARFVPQQLRAFVTLILTIDDNDIPWVHLTQCMTWLNKLLTLDIHAHTSRTGGLQTRYYSGIYDLLFRPQPDEFTVNDAFRSVVTSSVPMIQMPQVLLCKPAAPVSKFPETVRACMRASQVPGTGMQYIDIHTLHNNLSQINDITDVDVVVRAAVEWNQFVRLMDALEEYMLTWADLVAACICTKKARDNLLYPALVKHDQGMESASIGVLVQEVLHPCLYLCACAGDAKPRSDKMRDAVGAAAVAIMHSFSADGMELGEVPVDEVLSLVAKGPMCTSPRGTPIFRTHMYTSLSLLLEYINTKSDEDEQIELDESLALVERSTKKSFIKCVSVLETCAEDLTQYLAQDALATTHTNTISTLTLSLRFCALAAMSQLLSFLTPKIYTSNSGRLGSAQVLTQILGTMMARSYIIRLVTNLSTLDPTKTHEALVYEGTMSVLTHVCMSWQERGALHLMQCNVIDAISAHEAFRSIPGDNQNELFTAPMAKERALSFHRTLISSLKFLTSLIATLPMHKEVIQGVYSFIFLNRKTIISSMQIRKIAQQGSKVEVTLEGLERANAVVTLLFTLSSGLNRLQDKMITMETSEETDFSPHAGLGLGLGKAALSTLGATLIDDVCQMAWYLGRYPLPVVRATGSRPSVWRDLHPSTPAEQRLQEQNMLTIPPCSMSQLQYKALQLSMATLASASGFLRIHSHTRAPTSARDASPLKRSRPSVPMEELGHLTEVLIACLNAYRSLHPTQEDDVESLEAVHPSLVEVDYSLLYICENLLVAVYETLSALPDAAPNHELHRLIETVNKKSLPHSFLKSVGRKLEKLLLP